MASPSYLVVRNGWYHLRLRIPKDLSAYFPKHEVWKSLKTRDAGCAALIAERYLAKCRKVFALMRSGMVDREKILEIVSEEVKNLLFAHEIAREADYWWMSDSQMESLALHKLESYKEALATRDYNEVKFEITQIITKRKLGDCRT